MHSFRVEHVLLGDIVSWDAWEQGGNYHFRQISEINAEGKSSAREIFRKVVDGVCTKTLQINEYPASNLLERDGACLSLRDKGTIHIIEDEDRGYQIGFEIDGKKFTGEDLESLLGAFPGFSLNYQIADASAPVLKENEYLVPVFITKESLLEELENVIGMYDDGGFVSVEDIISFDDAFYRITDKLKVLANSKKHETALETGREMARMLLQLETDDDNFPAYEIQLICKIVDRFGLDDELKRIVADAYGV